jgi:hypothetical protein
MNVCTCCNSERPEVKIRVGLRTLDSSGKTTAKPFHGPLCGDCIAKISITGSNEQRWVLRQIVGEESERRVFQKANATGRRGVVASSQPVRVKPREPR